jgi:predicted permease
MFLESLDQQTISALLDPADRLADANSLGTATATNDIPTIEMNHLHHRLDHRHHHSSSPSTSPPSAADSPDASISVAIHQSHLGSQQMTLQTLPCFNDLIAVLIECFALISIGYLSGRFKVISPDAKDLGAYLTKFALPMIIFLNVAQMEIQTINLSFLACMLISKLIVFMLVSVVALAISYPTNFSYAGALAILSTQSNDFALGYPLFKSLYGESKPEMLNYLNLMGPIQLLIINPLGIIMLEYGKSQMRRRMRRRMARSGAATTTTTKAKTTTTTSAASILEKTDGHISQCPLHGEGSYLRRRSVARPTPAGNEAQSTSRLAMAAAGERRPAEPSELGIKRKNHKSLVLIMPATPALDSSLSDDSVGIKTPGLSGRFPQPPPPIAVQPSEVGIIVKLSKWLGSLFGPDSNGTRAAAGQQQQPAQVASSCTCCPRKPSNALQDPVAGQEPMVDLSFLRALMTNPLIIASLLALAVNLLHGPNLPKFVTKVSNTIAASFAAPALLVVGLSMYGKFKLILRNPNDLLIASVLVVTKNMVLPNVMRTVMQVVLPHYVDANEIPYLVDFSYLYGLLPTAPGACIIAKQYEVLTNVVSIGMLLSTFISAPLMLGTSVLISRANSITPSTIVQLMGRVLKISSSLTITLTLLALYLLLRSHRSWPLRSIGAAFGDATRPLKSNNLFIILLTVVQLIIGIGGFLWLFVDTSKLLHTAANKVLAHEENSFQATTMSNEELQAHLSRAAAATAVKLESGEWARIDSGVPEEPDLIAQDTDQLRGVLKQTLAARGLFPSNGGPVATSSVLAAGGGYPSTSLVACTLSFTQASGGLLLAKFIVLCIVVTNFARLSRGHQMAVQVSSLMLRVLPVVTMGIIVCLVFESKHLTCQPTESSLPRWPFSLYMRLIFNSTLLCLALSLFVKTLRLMNKAVQLRADDLVEPTEFDGGTGGVGGAGTSRTTGGLVKRQFVASTTSLSSGTSSELTTSTNLDASVLGAVGQSRATPKGLVTQHTGGGVADAAGNLLLDYGRYYEQSSEASLERAAELDMSSSTIVQGHDNEPFEYHTGTACDLNNNSNNININNNNNNDDDDDEKQTDKASVTIAGPHVIPFPVGGGGEAKLSERNPQLQRRRQDEPPPADACPTGGTGPWPESLPGLEFDKHSILAVFMMFQALISVTSIIQVILQDRNSTSKTFIMVELNNVIADIGQGVVTFLVVGSQFLSRKLVMQPVVFGSTQARQPDIA